MVKVVIIDSTIVMGRVAVVGEVFDLLEASAQLLISLGRAELAEKVLADPLAVRETTARRIPEKRIR